MDAPVFSPGTDFWALTAHKAMPDAGFTVLSRSATRSSCPPAGGAKANTFRPPFPTMTRMNAASRILIALLAVALAACQPGEQDAPPPAAVGTITVHARDVPLTHALVGRLAPTRTAEVRARVTGIVQKRAYQEGTDVDKDQLLFVIDPAPLKAALDEKQAQLKQDQANARNDQIKAGRTRQLAAKGVISRQALDDAEAAARASQAAVARSRAAVETAKLNLAYTRVTAPIAGRAGRAQVTEGALVSQANASLLTTIDQIDPLYVDFSQPMEVVESWRRQQAEGDVRLDKPGQMTVQLTLSDGSRYAHEGHLDFTDMRVDPDTGSVSLRATIANPGHQLLPGMFVQIELHAGTLRKVMLVPQQALLRDGNSAYVLSVDKDNKVHRTTVHARGSRDGNWIIDEGLSDGQRIIVSGLQRVRAGATVKPEPWAPASASSAPAD